ncbi:MAG: O-antigen ligase family protein [Rhizobiales bacterium]|nr:O-antigen ligase family protein [Hyphomicrobiales bacterium]
MAAITIKGFNRAALQRVADGLAAAVAISLPWSTSATSILIVLWLISLLPTLQISDLRRETITPAGGLPPLLWLLALAGMLWSEATFAERVSGIAGFHKLLVIPLLLAQFRRSERANWAINGFLISCAILLIFSWILVIFPKFPWHTPNTRGVPVKDYLTQSENFLLCFLALGYVGLDALGEGMLRRAALLLALAALFFANIMFVASGRTTLVLIPIFVVMLAFRFYRWKGIVVACVGGAILAGFIWVSSPYLRLRLEGIVEEVTHDRRDKAVTSAGMRLEFYRRSMDLIAQAPILGHGTGTIHTKFRQATEGETGAAGVATRNPHQQTFAVAIQLGIAGAALLWAMWIAHIALFRGAGFMSWLGLIVVLQNVLASLLNSHVFDFTQGWVYVFGVGVLGGTVLREATTVARGGQDAHR